MIFRHSNQQWSHDLHGNYRQYQNAFTIPNKTDILHKPRVMRCDEHASKYDGRPKERVSSSYRKIIFRARGIICIHTGTVWSPLTHGPVPYGFLLPPLPSYLTT